ncbi:hypothetical protein B5E41_29100 [Rhizobium esperanzae]|uniref:Uncharacterized protein n=1 Tax=Rhizobium esperanzae TaxID=1967781 RepID=A0A246DLB2_9HYPH|nr:hypothetical protein [Rhizobium esperanzae]OWO89986.1 hypothetical protein B5E41_29100 [Rhizobium esperanzae]
MSVDDQHSKDHEKSSEVRQPEAGLIGRLLGTGTSALVNLAFLLSIAGLFVFLIVCFVPLGPEASKGTLLTGLLGFSTSCAAFAFGRNSTGAKD